MKLYTVRFTAAAERQLAELYAYIADRSSEARANIYVARIIADCRALSTFPERGTRRDDIRPNLRVKGFERRVSIAFSIYAETETIAINGIFYGGQDFERLLNRSAHNE